MDYDPATAVHCQQCGRETTSNGDGTYTCLLDGLRTAAQVFPPGAYNDRRSIRGARHKTGEPINGAGPNVSEWPESEL